MDINTIKWRINEKEGSIHVNGREMDAVISQIKQHQKSIEEYLRDLGKTEKESIQNNIQKKIQYENDKIASLQSSLQDLQKERERLQKDLGRLNLEYENQLKVDHEKQIEKQKKTQNLQNAESIRQKEELQQLKNKQIEQGSKQPKTVNEPEEYERFVLAPINHKDAIRWIVCFVIVAFIVVLAATRFWGNDRPGSVNPNPQADKEPMMEDMDTSVFDTVPEGAIGAVYVKVDELFVRSKPSTEGNTPKRFAEKDGVYYVFDMVQDDKYTWYKIGEDEWIADHDREWVEFFQDLE